MKRIEYKVTQSATIAVYAENDIDAIKILDNMIDTDEIVYTETEYKQISVLDCEDEA